MLLYDKDPDVMHLILLVRGHAELGLGTSCAFEMCIDPPDDHPHAELCRGLLVATGLGGTHWLTLTSSQVIIGVEYSWLGLLCQELSIC